MPDNAPDPQWGWRERQILSARQAAAIAGHGVTHHVRVWLAWLSDIIVVCSGSFLCSCPSVSEALLRLADPEDTAVDVGANIGVMASAMAIAVGTTGKVVCFEPHPSLYLELSANIAGWQEALHWNHVEASDLALSEHPGEAALAMSGQFDSNRGTASLAARASSEGPTRHVIVQTTTLDLALGDSQQFGLLKVDVEGHEFEVLKGATSLLSSGRVRDIVFEEYGTYPSPVTNLLESYGYKVFALRKGVLGPLVQSPSDVRLQLEWETPNYLATNDAQRAMARLRPIGWRSLRRQRPTCPMLRN